MVETIFFSKTKRVIPREEARWEYQEGKKQANLPKPKPQGITTFLKEKRIFILPGISFAPEYQ